MLPKEFDRCFYSKKNLPNNTTPYEIVHFNQDGITEYGNIKTPNKFPVNVRFTLHKLEMTIMSRLDNATGGAIPNGNLNQAGRLIRGSFIKLSIYDITYFEFPLTQFLDTFPIDNGGNTERMLAGAITLNKPIVFDSGQDFQFIHVINPFNTNLDQLAVEFRMRGFVTPTTPGAK